MASMSIRGLDEQTLAQLKQQAAQECSSLNSLVLRLLQNTEGPDTGGGLRRFDDLDPLAGTWSGGKARAFERDTAAFAELDPALWR